jgi:hypothetical protein
MCFSQQISYCSRPLVNALEAKNLCFFFFKPSSILPLSPVQRACTASSIGPAQQTCRRILVASAGWEAADRTTLQSFHLRLTTTLPSSMLAAPAPRSRAPTWAGTVRRIFSRPVFWLRWRRGSVAAGGLGRR